MALPADYDSMRSGEDAERTDDVSSYKVTCMDFIKDVSHDYLAWVDYYKLPPEEDKRRRDGISATIERSNEWIAKVAQTIKGVDVAMNDGIQKMAESTAGKPFQIGVFVNKMSGYTSAPPGMINVSVKAAGREGRGTRLGFHFKDDRFRLESTCKPAIDETGLPAGDFDLMDFAFRIDATKCIQRDLISFTVTVCETKGGDEVDRRGLSTIIHIV
ncbi:hypothetical protein CENSYa_1147 [Cenarchaeum symbiosum A]|uniref:Uncharacterized protein n=1 Tax=Cenarchaeum symbiosum (strain A) TaxID=414004 RepID=A0RWQ7_CENSY|nr:hypothetical protein CENSYa_1147 [Cenarchaeum symbiosum A]